MLLEHEHIEDPLENTLTMSKFPFSFAALLDLLNISNLISFRRPASQAFKND